MTVDYPLSPEKLATQPVYLPQSINLFRRIIARTFCNQSPFQVKQGGTVQ